jgi:hypothetical protein
MFLAGVLRSLMCHFNYSFRLGIGISGKIIPVFPEEKQKELLS